MKNIIPAVKGTRDFYPEQMAIRNWLYAVVRQVSESFGYQEYEAPFLESLDLYAAKSGDELIQGQSYVFQDRGGNMVTLRPELTPSLARMIARRQNDLVFPVRWWSFGPFWRYERPQKGRTREFFQWNVDLLGADSPEADAENVAVLATFFRHVGLTRRQIEIAVSNRRLLDMQFSKMGILVDRRPVISAWIDRREKLTLDSWLADGREIGLYDKQLDAIQVMLEDKDLWKQSDELVRFFEAVKVLGVDDYIRFEPGIVRGLTYYTGTVFEAWEVGGNIRRSILGGGRYDNLLRDVGGDPLPGVGYAMGDVVMMLMLEKYGLLPDDLRVSPAQVMVTIFDQERLLDSFKLAVELRGAGLKVVCYPEAAKLPRQFKYADRMEMRVALVLGPDEVAAGQVTVKNLATGTQQTCVRSEIFNAVRRVLEGG